MMSVSAHDRIAGRPARMRVLEDFIRYAQSHPGVSFHAQSGYRELCDHEFAHRPRGYLMNNSAHLAPRYEALFGVSDCLRAIRI